MQGGDETKPKHQRQCPVLPGLSYLNCEFVVSLPSSVTRGLRMDFVESIVLHCPSLSKLPKYQCAAQMLDLGSVAPEMNSCICFNSVESTEIQWQCKLELLVIVYNFCSTNSVFQEGVKLSAEMRWACYYAVVSFQSVVSAMVSFLENPFVVSE